MPVDVVGTVETRLDAPLGRGRSYLALVLRLPNAHWLYRLYGPVVRGARDLLAVNEGSDSEIETLRVVLLNGRPVLIRVVHVFGTANGRITTAVEEIDGVLSRVAYLAGNEPVMLGDQAGLRWSRVDGYGSSCTPPSRYTLWLLSRPDGFLPVDFDIASLSAGPVIGMRSGTAISPVTDAEARVVAAGAEPSLPIVKTYAARDDQRVIAPVVSDLLCRTFSREQLDGARVVLFDATTPRTWSFDALLVTRDDRTRMPTVWSRIALQCC